jgi:hypothetical protein
MKRAGLIVLVGMLAGSVQAQFLEEGFDTAPLGPISSQPRWAGSFIPGFILPGVVTNAMPLAGGQTVELPLASGGLLLGSSMQFTATNPLAPRAGQGSMIRAAGWIYRENLAQRLSITVGSTGLAALEFYEDADGTLVFTNRVTGYGVDTGQRMVTNRYAEFVIHFDTRTNAVAVDYDGGTLVKYNGGAGGKLTNLNYFSVFRSAGAGTEGLVLVDEMRVEGFPTNIVAWWRMGEHAEQYLDDQVGTFDSTNYAPAPLLDLLLCDDWIYDGTRDVSNRGAKSGYFQPGLRAWRTQDIGTNWTFEAILQEGTNSDSQAVLMELINPTGVGSAHTNTMISVYLASHPSSNLTRMVASLRSEDHGDQPANFLPFGNAAIVPRDGQWHHLALVNNGSLLSVYIDYALVATNSLPFASSGNYRITSGSSVAYLGSGLAGGAGADLDQGLDEMRLTGRALQPAQFLYASSPRFIRWEAPPGETFWLWTYAAPPGVSNLVQSATNLIAGPSWTEGTWVTPTGYVSSIQFFHGAHPDAMNLRFSRPRR